MNLFDTNLAALAQAAMPVLCTEMVELIASPVVIPREEMDL